MPRWGYILYMQRSFIYCAFAAFSPTYHLLNTHGYSKCTQSHFQVT